MKLIKTEIDGLFLIECIERVDNRGSFVKTFNIDSFYSHGINPNFKESYFSISNKNVIRGMHFQIPPDDHAKLVYVSKGRVLDVVLDIRLGSPTYGRSLSFELSSQNRMMLYLESGLAHGFLSLEEHTIMTYMQTSCYSPKNDAGIRYDSFGFDWGKEDALLSERDRSFLMFNDFKSPFTYEK